MLPDQDGHLDLADVQAALAQPPPSVRESPVLVGLENASYEQAAAIMGCKTGIVKSRVRRARDQLAWRLGYRGVKIGSDAVLLSARDGPSGVGK